MWKIVLITLVACSDPAETVSKDVYPSEVECMKVQAQMMRLGPPSPGSYLVCRHV